MFLSSPEDTESTKREAPDDSSSSWSSRRQRLLGAVSCSRWIDKATNAGKLSGDVSSDKVDEENEEDEEEEENESEEEDDGDD